MVAPSEGLVVFWLPKCNQGDSEQSKHFDFLLLKKDSRSAPRKELCSPNTTT